MLESQCYATHAVTSRDEVDAVRVAAVGDLHVTDRMRDRVRTELTQLSEHADILLLAGDLTNAGLPSQADVLADALSCLGLPIVAVLGNHDYDESRRAGSGLLSGVGVTVLDGTSAIVDVRDTRIGIAGTVGFDGGFGLDHRLWEAVSEGGPHRREHDEARRFGKALTDLAGQGADIRIALTHFSPVPGTLAGEDDAIKACLGNELLGFVIDDAGADLAVHGHAHHGTECGRTQGGIPVRNVARPVLDRPYAVYALTPRGIAAAES